MWSFMVTRTPTLGERSHLASSSCHLHHGGHDCARFHNFGVGIHSSRRCDEAGTVELADALMRTAYKGKAERSFPPSAVLS